MTDTKSKLEIADRDYGKLAPWFAEKVAQAVDACKEAGYPILVTECYRSPARQSYLYEQGRTRPGKRVTDAKAWESFHNYSLAIDICLLNGKKPFWPKKDDPLWDRVDQIFEGLGFESLGFERPHHQISAGMTWQEAYRIAKDQGLLAVWNLVELRIRS